MTERPQPESARSVARAPSFASSLPFPGLWRYRRTETTRSSDVDRLEIGRLPTPGARAVAARRNPLPVDRGDDLAVAGKQRFGRAHLGAKRQLAFGQPVGAVLRDRKSTRLNSSP